MVKKYRLFELETKMIKDVLPEVHKLLQESKIENFSPFSAKFLYSHFGSPYHVIVLEDLKESGFEMAERTEGLDLPHCMMVMRKIALFHAASLVLREKHPELLEDFYDPLSQDMFPNEFREFLKSFLNALCDEIDEKHQDLQKYSGRLREIGDCAIGMWAKGRARDKKEYCVLAHGDVWLNNFMFQYSKNDRQLIDIR